MLLLSPLLRPILEPILNRILGAGNVVTYLLKEDFGVDAAAPYTGAKTAVPGPGTYTAVDTDTKQAITGAGLVWTGGAAAFQAGNPGTYMAGRARANGLCMMSQFRPSVLSGTTYMGWGTSSASGAPPTEAGILYSNGNIQPNAAVSISHSYDQHFIYDHHIEATQIVHAAGALHFVRGGMARRSRLVWAEHTTATATLYARLANLVHQGAVRRWRVTNDLPGVYNTHYGIATSRSATTANGDTATHEADAIVEHTITAATGVTQELMVRRTDDSNCLIVRMDQAGSTIKLIEKIGGSETEVWSAAQTWTNATQYRIVVTLDGALALVHVATTLKGTTNNRKLLTANTGAKVSHAGSNLVCWPRYVTLPTQVPMLTGAFLGYGDSKTGGQGSTDGLGYRSLLAPLLAGDWNEEPGTISIGGYKIGEMKATVDADLATRFNDPSVILFNLGVNDISFVAGNEAQLESDLGYIWDALHVKYPDATIFAARVWKNVGATSEFNLLNNTIIPAAMVGRSWVHLGIDERLILPGASGIGTEYTTDGIHPNDAGYALVAAAWRDVLVAAGLAT